jgi:DNA replication and repair protein RecF
VWMTGADPAALSEVGASGEIFEVENGAIARRM